jgi:hypothetical protein
MPKCISLKSSSAVIGSGTRPARYRHFPVGEKERKRGNVHFKYANKTKML